MESIIRSRKRLFSFTIVILSLFLPTDSCDRIGASCYLRNVVFLRSEIGAIRAVVRSHVHDFTLLALSVSSKHNTRSTSLKTSFAASIAPKCIFNAIESNGPSSTFFLNDKNMCLEPRARWYRLNVVSGNIVRYGLTNKSHAIYR